jgi:parallel beta-helix repeat protein
MLTTQRIALTAILALTVATFAGPLAPPAGPVAPTPGPEPRTAINATNTPGDPDSLYKITLPGSYYLTGNITGVSGLSGIEIAASGVTIDLNGFDLQGVPGSLDAVTNSGLSQTNLAVSNGSVRNWGGDGVDLSASVAFGCCVERVVSSGNSGAGIRISVGSTASNCTAFSNGGHGIATGTDCTISGCSVYASGQNGINAGVGSTITLCTAFSNTGSGIVAAGSGCTISNCTSGRNSASGINAGTGGTVLNCTSSANNADGIVLADLCVIRGNNCTGNGFIANDGAGIHATSTDNRIEGNNCTGADRGIDVDFSGNFISRNVCSGNTNNWDVVSGNIILVVNAATAGAVTGNAGGTAPGSTDPNANFTY